ncbi:bifunctional diaminohydroxyphosphoribosylaminopyrimidine deaminase/5-amino-6-(5-phosphoribosylamino)uracil reductase RibD [Virgibacillus sp. 179-BFC.A HS]|uniref:Riboflavin biosynthesis protein RibD n=1 Tax=Tigheibacillus jepli TaxID=3035914 RepID=A0ABU5CH73_9BACI|nr:bifunctional diaminohydroxyphosphoribosylaminopyrimidine deaminase/5-amino-6-(5-phosphoribosylamino)uracil reductase RibD [Virgibacillus sp. 179-BFC.A HS]MDY0405177.1 bifunctional diaminohydroxyphosphoribosylaminopyrimidine deaminase/5-amino-6-(5-phosphoribosylamino)uracil reductase RibD [Virgibacillus sp. 179-BFC.A HS]
MTSEQLMQLALDEAARGCGMTHTNPVVGAVIVKNGKIIGKGYHAGFGKEHAEIAAMKSVAHPEDMKGASMYVTLEPCSHFGKTPPCCESITAAGIAHVHIAQLDPNPLVSGKGKAYLQTAGIHVTVGLMEEQARKHNRFYNFYHEKGRPFITVKYAMTLDGKINQTSGKRSLITGEKSHGDVQKLRSMHQAILIGAATALTDDPQLTVHQREMPHPPIRVVIDRRGRITDALRIIQQDDAPTWIFTQTYMKKLASKEHVTVFYKKAWTMADVIKKLTDKGVQSVLVEGGARIQQAFLQAEMVDEIVAYVAPTLFGAQALPAFYGEKNSTNTMQFQKMSAEMVGKDVKITAYRE